MLLMIATAIAWNSLTNVSSKPAVASSTYSSDYQIDF